MAMVPREQACRRSGPNMATTGMSNADAACRNPESTHTIARSAETRRDRLSRERALTVEAIPGPAEQIGFDMMER